MEEQASGFDDHALAPMVSLELNVAMFKSQWQFCDRITEYLSDILGQGHSDPARYSNFLSVAANELIELAFRSTGEPGRISFSLYRSATFNRLRIAFAREDRGTGMKSTEHQSRSGAGSDLTSDGTIMLKDLATIFRAAIRIEQDGAHGMQIIADFPSAEDFQ
ncbi:hypothetical protein Rleg4DRAFT_1454 [Rhizobium leguminosarum bv. trifolii WSM2297]|uniref:Histidine kinase/HSP90-like ATPase domain-containing protein n=1 Tax=Rhizobium leguminosarum bv. trifolii WSM2297 TaxID=754762 RepID=J0C9V9_RHILT|nr:hypothetical protein [Rhizobium leguminosarum]EJC79852.1 hypothetical protein Rleg4DRAFT_1454 [Rhizobium leguminosarum bv. trifolii WSM2297]